MLATPNHRSENVVIKASIIPELELCNVKMQVLFAHVVEGADDTALEDASETFNRLGMNSTNDVLVPGMTGLGRFMAFPRFAGGYNHA
jgi:hypothetical protein